MTRRLEPMERFTELGDALVPFRFDVHALAFVEDAPKIDRYHEIPTVPQIIYSASVE